MERRKPTLILAATLISATLIGAATFVMMDSGTIPHPNFAETASPSERSMTLSFNGSGLNKVGSSSSGIEYSYLVTPSFNANGLSLSSAQAFGNSEGTPINNLTSISIAKEGTGSVKLHVAYKAGVYAEYGTIDSKVTFSGSYAAPMPRYFLLSASGEVILSEVTFTYGCGENNTANPVSNPGTPNVYTLNGNNHVTGVTGTVPALGYFGQEYVNGIDVGSNTDLQNLTGMKVLSLSGAVSLSVPMSSGYKFATSSVEFLDLRDWVNSNNTIDYFKYMDPLKKVLIGKKCTLNKNWFDGCKNIEAIYLAEEYNDFDFGSNSYVAKNKADCIYKYTSDHNATGDNYWTYDFFSRPYVVSTKQ